MIRVNKMIDDEKILINCPHCKGLVDIKKSSVFDRFVVKLKTLREELRLIRKHQGFIHQGKNGTIQSLHKIIGVALDTMTEEQRKEFKLKSQYLKDEVRMWEKGK